MNLLSDVITYIRRIIKTPSNASVSDDLLIDYVNRFWIMDVSAEMQLFDLKKKYSFQTTPGIDRYNMPLYSLQVEQGNQPIRMYPVYQGFLGPAYINGVQVMFQTQQESFFRIFPNIVQNMQVVAVGNGTAGPYSFQFPIGQTSANIPLNPPIETILPGHIDISGIIATGINQDPPLVPVGSGVPYISQIPVTSVDAAVFLTTTGPSGENVVVSDSGQFLQSNRNYGLLMSPGNAPFGNTSLPSDGINPAYSTTSNTINYQTGQGNVIFNVPIPQGVNINAQCYFFQSGLPRMILYYNNTLTLRAPPSQQYLVELDAYLSPAAFLSTTESLQFGYMAEYIARGAARKILLDTGDVEQFNFYEPEFIRQQNLVWKRSQRQWTSTRTETIYSQGIGAGYIYNNYGGGGTL